MPPCRLSAAPPRAVSSLQLLTLSLLIAGVPAAQAQIPRPEHPRPQALRQAWLNLNGRWEFAETDNPDDYSFLKRERFDETILVPFCREAPLSGLGRTHFVKCVWYRRSFRVPETWADRRVLLHIDACDWLTTVWIDGHELGRHVGGNVPITFELTGFLRPEGNTLTVRAFDDPRSGLQQLGKQSRRPESYGIFYTRTTGIWQTVWLEAVGPTWITDLHILPDAELGRVILNCELDGPTEGLTLRTEVFAEKRKVGQTTRPVAGRCATSLVVLGEKHLWSPDDPFLYTVRLTLRRDEEVIDELESYFGLRQLTVEGRQFLINGRPIFQRLVLDQGYYPDGIWTAPSDAALRRDIELARSAGFNGARLHQKVFEPRFHYWADRLGYLTWAEGPSFGADYGNPAVNLPVVAEWVAIVRRDRNHPSIIGWCPFNETPAAAAALQNTVYELVRALDPTRPVIDSSGWYKSHPDPDVTDAHDYTQDPARLARRWAQLGETRRFPPQYGAPTIDRPFFLSEFGGIGWIPPGEKGWGYGDNPRTPEEFYARYDGLMRVVQSNRFMFGFCYTQLTDVEQERNGLFYYDRRPKFDLARLRALTARPAAYEQDPPPPVPLDAPRWRILLPAAVDRQGPTVWHYTTTSPPEGWQLPEFDDSGWDSGPAGFGHKAGWEQRTNTAWTTPDIWLRTSFTCDGQPFAAAVLMLHYDNATTIYLNGGELLALEGWNDGYLPYDVTERLRRLLRPGRNQLAVHVHQDTGGQFFDLAILVAGG